MKSFMVTVGMDEFKKSSLLFLLTRSLLILAVAAATDTIDISQTIRDGDTLVSSGGKFEFGFFSPGNSTNRRYVGMWYKNISVRTYVWVANRQAPLASNSGVLRVIQPGILALFNHSNGTIIWSTNATRTVGSPVAQLLDTGNLVVKDANDDRPQNYLWQSFDYPSDSFLPGMSLGWDFRKGLEVYLSSWRSADDPAPGEFTIHFDPSGVPQILLKRGEAVRYRIGPWNGIRFSGGPTITSRNPIYPVSISRSILMNENEVTFTENTEDESLVTRAMMNISGHGERWIWDRQAQAWGIFSFLGEHQCDSYNLCGANGVCNIGNSQPCGCLDRFVPEDRDRSNGCIRRTRLTCQGDVFVKYSEIKLPDSRNSTFDGRRMRLADCEVECSRNCSCTAYTQLDLREEESGCVFYYGELKDIRTLAQGGQDLYIRMASTELGSKGKKRVILTASFISLAGVVVLCLCLILFCRRRRKNDPNRTEEEGLVIGNHSKEESELPFFPLSTILKATDHFSNKNKLGEGGFGPVYKGMLDDGQEVAVKCLSKTSSQGVDELKNEVILIAKLQHRNLVRTLGCCVDGEEKILVYEYMPNKSLDLILFDKARKLFDWQKRFHIINGIAKGLLYLHQDSRLRIIHRDLKASNVLLDAEMNPKISDFGLARSFGGNQTEAWTRKVVGTYGYMSPEYAADGLFSIKSDVFSFGVLVLEIVSGKRNKGFFLKDDNLNLIGHAWRLYKTDNLRQLVDPALGDSFNMSEVLRSIHVGLLCVQNSPEDRPNMSSVVFMLGNEVELPQAKQPGFFREIKDVMFGQNSSSTNAANSGNQVTITMPEGR